MSHRLPVRSLVVAALGAFALAACTSSTAPAPSTSIVSISPDGGSTSISTGADIAMTFSDSMMTGMSAYMSLHMGSIGGAAVPMTAHWSADHHTLTMTPNAPLAAGTTYYIHMGGGMTDANDRALNYGACPGFGGQSATSGMMGGMMGGMSGEMGPGWMSSNGTYGWIFSFRTA